MKTGDVAGHFTELDRVKLPEYDDYMRYFEFMRLAYTRLIISFNERSTEDPMEVELIKSYLQKMLNSIEALRLKYLFETDNQMLIDVTDSGYPNHMEFRKIEADLEVRDEKVKATPSTENLKRSVLDFMFANQARPQAILKDLGRAEYFQSLNGEELFRLFTKGKLKQLYDDPQKRGFLYHWGSYDTVTNRPFIYILVFDYDKTIDEKIEENGNFLEMIKKVTHNTAPLKVMAADIDASFECILPKVLKRVDIGPIYSHYAKEGHDLTKIVQENFGHDDYAFLFTTEIVFSVGAKRNKSFLSKGELRQIFFVDESNKECIERNVSKVHKYMMASHKLIQYLSNHDSTYLKSLAMPPLTFVANQ